MEIPGIGSIHLVLDLSLQCSSSLFKTSFKLLCTSCSWCRMLGVCGRFWYWSMRVWSCLIWAWTFPKELRFHYESLLGLFEFHCQTVGWRSIKLGTPNFGDNFSRGSVPCPHHLKLEWFPTWIGFWCREQEQGGWSLLSVVRSLR